MENNMEMNNKRKREEVLEEKEENIDDEYLIEFFSKNLTEEELEMEKIFQKDPNEYYIEIEPLGEPFECLLCHKDKNVNEVLDDEYIYICIPCINLYLPNFKNDLYTKSWLSLFGPQTPDPGDEYCQICKQLSRRGFNIPICTYHEKQICP